MVKRSPGRMQGSSPNSRARAAQAAAGNPHARKPPTPHALGPLHSTPLSARHVSCRGRPPRAEQISNACPIILDKHVHLYMILILIHLSLESWTDLKRMSYHSKQTRTSLHDTHFNTSVSGLLTSTVFEIAACWLDAVNVRSHAQPCSEFLFWRKSLTIFMTLFHLFDFYVIHWSVFKLVCALFMLVLYMSLQQHAFLLVKGIVKRICCIFMKLCSLYSFFKDPEHFCVFFCHIVVFLLYLFVFAHFWFFCAFLYTFVRFC